MANTNIRLDDNGYLADFYDGNPGVAAGIAEAEMVRMAEQHWDVVYFLREYYARYQIAPMIKVLVKEMGKKFGPDKGTMRYLYTLFPEGPAKQACKIAGLPRPTGCV